MKWNLIEVNGQPYEKKYQVMTLSGKLLAAADLDGEQIEELMMPNAIVTTSQAPCVIQACQRIQKAQKDHEKVFVAGDYDADGVCSTAIMKATLDAMHIENGFYIPDRMKEGYGLAKKTVQSAASKGYTLIITVDNGVKAHEALIEAHQLGISTIVTDHHIIEEEVACDILVHPTLLEPQYQYLSGAGVALEISRTLIGDNEDLTALAGIAAVGDVMPLWKETRILVEHALDSLKQRRPMPLAALLRRDSGVDETAVAFNIVPKLNSVGRMSDVANVNTVPQFLLCRDENQTIRYAAQLEKVNELRKKRSEVQIETAERLINDDPFLLLYDESFHEGICGMTASAVADKYKRPTLVMAKCGTLIKGSGRGIPGFDMYSFFSDFDELTAFGGHAQAAGLSIQAADLASFKEHVENKMKQDEHVYAQPEGTAVLIGADDVCFDSLSDLQRLSPYPKELKDLHFALEHPEILERRETAKMVKYRIANRFGGFDAVLYKRRNIQALEHPKILIGSLNINRWNGRISCQMVIDDMQSD